MQGWDWRNLAFMESMTGRLGELVSGMCDWESVFESKLMGVE